MGRAERCPMPSRRAPKIRPVKSSSGCISVDGILNSVGTPSDEYYLGDERGSPWSPRNRWNWDPSRPLATDLHEPAGDFGALCLLLWRKPPALAGPEKVDGLGKQLIPMDQELSEIDVADGHDPEAATAERVMQKLLAVRRADDDA
jgi:hypothetical protein